MTFHARGPNHSDNILTKYGAPNVFLLFRVVICI